MTTDTLIAGTTQNTGDSTPAAATAAPAPAPADTTPASAAQPQPASDAQNADAKPAGDKPASDKPAGDKPADDQAKPAGAPEKYEFKSPEGMQFDAALLTDFETVARELDMPQDAAQKLVETMGPKIAAQHAAQQQEAFKNLNNTWIEATKSDKEFGGDKLAENLAVAKKALDKTASPELRTLLNETGLGNHPEVIRHFVKIGKTLSEDTFVPGGAPSGPANDAKAMYPNSNMK